MGPASTEPLAGTGVSGNNVHYRTQVFRLTCDACTIYSSQGYDGYLHLYAGSFDPNNPLTNLVDGDDDGELGVGTSRIPHDLSHELDLSPRRGLYPRYQWLRPDQHWALPELHPVQRRGCPVQPLHGDCGVFFVGIPEEQQVCLQDRFVVAIDQITNHATDGIGTPVRFGSTDSAFFWFYNDRNFEMLVKVLNGCGINNHWWVFFAGTTNQGYRVRVGDAQTLQVKTYIRPLGPVSLTETDTSAFATCP